MQSRRHAVALAFAALLSVAAQAQTYPSKPVRVVVPFPPGSGADIVTRIVVPRLADALGQQFVVDNRAGAAGHIGAEVVAHSAADGYTLLFTPASIAVSRALYTKLNYDLEKDFDTVALAASAPFVLVVHPSLPVKTLKDLVALAKARPGQLLYASTGNGGTPHLATELLKRDTGIDIVHVPYKGTPAAVTDLIGGQVQLMFANTLSVLPLTQSGKLRAIAISGAKRSGAAPQIPTVAESGVPGFDAATWFGILAPHGTSKDIVARLSSETVKIVQTSTVRNALLAQGADPIGMPAEQFAAYLKAEIAKWEKAVKATGVKIGGSVSVWARVTRAYYARHYEVE